MLIKYFIKARRADIIVETGCRFPNAVGVSLYCRTYGAYILLVVIATTTKMSALRALEEDFAPYLHDLG